MERRKKKSSRPSSGSRARSAFTYKAPSSKKLKERANQQAGDYDSPFKQDYQLFKPQEGDNLIRILPMPAESDLDYWGMEIWINYDVGPDKNKYLSLSKMRGEPDPIEEELRRAQAEGEDEDYIKDLKPTKRLLCWVIDRENEREGPMLYSMPWTFDRDLGDASIDKQTNEILYIDHPEEGFDIDFKKTGQGKKTKYSGPHIARRPSPLSDDPELMDEWLEFVVENPLEDVLQWYDYDHIKGRLMGSGSVDDLEEEEEEAPRTRRSRRSAEKIEDEDESLDEESLGDGFEQDSDSEDEEPEDSTEEDEGFEDFDEDDSEKPRKSKRNDVRDAVRSRKSRSRRERG